MQPQRYLVRSGDTFWDITKRHYGNATHWPELYAFNNQPGIVAATHNRIVNPNLIRPGQTLFLPPRQALTAARRQTPATASPGVAAGRLPQVGQQDTRNFVPLPSSPTSVGAMPSVRPQTLPSPGVGAQQPDNPADVTPANDFGFAYYLQDLPVATVQGPGFTATLTYKGVVFLQSTSHVPLVVYSNKGAEVQARHEATNVLGQLVSGAKLAWDRKDNKVTFECQMTARANAQSVGTQLSAGIDSRGQPVLKATVVFPRFTGRLRDYVYVARDFKIEVELKPDQDTQRLNPQPVPVQVPAAQPQTDRRLIWGVALIGAAVVVVGATLLQDAVTEGAGVADNPELFGLAYRLFQLGRTALTTQMTPMALGAGS